MFKYILIVCSLGNFVSCSKLINTYNLCCFKNRKKNRRRYSYNVKQIKLSTYKNDENSSQTPTMSAMTLESQDIRVLYNAENNQQNSDHTELEIEKDKNKNIQK